MVPAVLEFRGVVEPWQDFTMSLAKNSVRKLYLDQKACALAIAARCRSGWRAERIRFA